MDPYWFGSLDEGTLFPKAWRVCLMFVSCSGSSERGGVSDHYEAAAADPAGSRPGDPGRGGPEHGQVSPCFLVDLPEDTRCQRYLALRMSNYLYYFQTK